jgi:hypothetical protein
LEEEDPSDHWRRRILVITGREEVHGDHWRRRIMVIAGGESWRFLEEEDPGDI